jgi:hypothetical protein
MVQHSGTTGVVATWQQQTLWWVLKGLFVRKMSFVGAYVLFLNWHPDLT